MTHNVEYDVMFVPKGIMPPSPVSVASSLASRTPPSSDAPPIHNPRNTLSPRKDWDRGQKQKAWRIRQQENFVKWKHTETKAEKSKKKQMDKARKNKYQTY